MIVTPEEYRQILIEHLPKSIGIVQSVTITKINGEQIKIQIGNKILTPLEYYLKGK